MIEEAAGGLREMGNLREDAVKTLESMVVAEDGSLGSIAPSEAVDACLGVLRERLAEQREQVSQAIWDDGRLPGSVEWADLDERTSIPDKYRSLADAALAAFLGEVL